MAFVLTVQSIEYDRRLAGTFPSLSIPDRLREDILQALLEEGPTNTSGEFQSAFLANVADNAPATATQDEDKILLRTFVSYNVLVRLGFAEARINQCLSGGLKAGGNWEDALEWVSYLTGATVDRDRCGYT